MNFRRYGINFYAGQHGLCFSPTNGSTTDEFTGILSISIVASSVEVRGDTTHYLRNAYLDPAEEALGYRHASKKYPVFACKTDNIVFVEYFDTGLADNNPDAYSDALDIHSPPAPPEE